MALHITHYCWGGTLQGDRVKGRGGGGGNEVFKNLVNLKLGEKIFLKNQKPAISALQVRRATKSTAVARGQNTLPLSFQKLNWLAVSATCTVTAYGIALYRIHHVLATSQKRDELKARERKKKRDTLGSGRRPVYSSITATPRDINASPKPPPEHAAYKHVTIEGPQVQFSLRHLCTRNEADNSRCLAR